MRSIHNDDRRRKSTKILSILQDYLKGEEKHLICLDVGCSTGIISNHLAENFQSVIAVDIDIKPQPEHRAGGTPRKYALFALASGQELPFTDNSFDVVICAQVYEHVDDQEALASEIYRVLKPGGICFFSGPNRLAVIEEHYWLPFLSWFPQPLSSLYMRLFKKGKKYDAYPLFYWQLLRLWNKFGIIDLTLDLLRNPERYSVSERVLKYPLINILPDWVLLFLKPLYPNYNWILKKNARSN